MRLLFIRHGDPDYTIDSLTETGWKEAKLLATRLSNMEIDSFYVSPLGRARDTASVTLQAIGQEAQVLPWLQEFPPEIQKPGEDCPSCLWDFLPELWTSDPLSYDCNRWFTSPLLQGQAEAEYRKVTQGLDDLLAGHGYLRDGAIYRTREGNTKTLAFFCHFGLTCVLLSHLLHISPVLLWHGTCAAPTSITTLTTEERRKGIAHFRMNSFGDISHLYAAGEEPSFAARFCETFESPQRHD